MFSAHKQQEQLTEWCASHLTLSDSNNTSTDLNTDDDVADLEASEVSISVFVCVCVCVGGWGQDWGLCVKHGITGS